MWYVERMERRTSSRASFADVRQCGLSDASQLPESNGTGRDPCVAREPGATHIWQAIVRRIGRMIKKMISDIQVE